LRRTINPGIGDGNTEKIETAPVAGTEAQTKKVLVQILIQKEVEVQVEEEIEVEVEVQGGENIDMKVKCHYQIGVIRGMITAQYVTEVLENTTMHDVIALLVTEVGVLMATNKTADTNRTQEKSPTLFHE
jgi:hypothetical protein